MMQPKSPSSLLIMASVHELEALRRMLEVALAQLQMPTGPTSQH
jgi:hypothetical protein